MTTQHILKSIDEASQAFGNTWPLYSFVTSNPLSGYETTHFEQAAKEAEKRLGAKTYPDALVYKQAWELGDIDKETVSKLLKKNGFFEKPEFYLEEIKAANNQKNDIKDEQLDVIMAKWLAVFMDEGLAEWQMPGKKKGFYSAWKLLAAHEGVLQKETVLKLPISSLEAIETVLKSSNVTNYTELFKQHLAPLSGWIGYIKHREQTNSLWQQTYPISIQDYLAVRFIYAHHFYKSVTTKNLDESTPDTKLKHIWLQAWEQTFQNKLTGSLKQSMAIAEKPEKTTSHLDAQLVFCIDTRSELIRRHIESKGSYETFGYAGFFGIAMDYQNYQETLTRKSCPPIVGSHYLVTENPKNQQSNEEQAFIKNKKLSKSTETILKRLKNMLPSSFGFIEGAGFFYGISLTLQTLLPKYIYKFKAEFKPSHENFCEPEITYNHCETHAGNDITIEEKVAIVKSGFDLMGWKNFAPLVLFIGHGSHTTNNPFGSSLDCGACAASPGRHNARLLAKLANLKSVRTVLKEVHGINIPENTLFIGGEHNTTTDAITLFDAHVKNETQRSLLEDLKKNLAKAQETATADRLLVSKNSVSLANKKATNWAETRPEWGLAKNAGFIVAPRALSKNLNLQSRCFLHSYDYKLDTNGEALEGIMCGPMVVTQWINNHYYFTTVDNGIFGGGSKISHNITGRFGVVQGNGGDLKMGLPLESLNKTDTEMYHQPLRLTVVIQAPLQRVEAILNKHGHLKTLLDNEWIYLKVINTDNSNEFYHYSKNFNWQSNLKIAQNSLPKKQEAILKN